LWNKFTNNSISQEEILLTKGAAMAKLSVDKALLKAKSHAKKGEVEEAQKLYQAILNAFPKNKRAQQGLVALNKSKQSAATQSPPQDTINQLINLYNQGQLAAVVEQAQALTEQYHEAFVIWNILGVAAVQTGQLNKAIIAFQRVIAIKPDYAEAYSNMGNALQDQGKLEEAIEVYIKALSLKPDYAEAYNNMGNVLLDQGKLEEAIEAFNKALSLTPDYSEAFYNMGNALKEQGKLDEATEAYYKALSIKPDYAAAYNNRGVALQDQGKLDEAIASYNKALSLKPDYAGVYRNLSALINYERNHPQVAVVGELLNRSDLKDEDRCHLHYTFAKMKEDLGDLDAAYDNYVAGGKLKQKLMSYDFKQDKQTFDQIKITAPKLKQFSFNKPIEATTNTPIFILGMPRSGTTLVEQIISCHSQVHGAGELSLLSRFGEKLSRGLEDISSDTLLNLRNSYLTELEKVSENKPFVTDKTPQNFLQIALILKALPEAKIIHVNRDPMATCWSNFKHYFSTKGIGYSYDLDDTMSYYKLYQDLMEFWDQHYGCHIYHLDYDRLTIGQEIETRKLIEHIELGWQDACLSPQDNKRSVSTASQQQVREKVYTGSSQAWRKFEPYINGAFDELLT
jgi:tetratricopeptide (TPR) repeat protein